MSQDSHPAEIQSLTGLRFVAAFYVFVFHMQIRWPIVSGGALKPLVDQGAVGMSLFFILSGYVLSLRHFGSRMNLQNYYRGRFARIYPVYLLAAVVTLPWISAHFGPSGHFEYDINFRQLIFLIFSNIFALQAWLPDMFFYWNDGGSWSISVEVFFYALFPLLIGLISKLEPRKFLFAIIICYVATALPGLSLSAFYTARDAAFYSVPIYRLPEFLLGIFTFVLTKRYPGVIQQRYVADAVVAALIVYLTLLVL